MNNINHFVKNIIPAGNLKKGYDFKFVSFFVFDMDHLEFQTVDQYHHFSTKEMIEKGSTERTLMDNILQYLNEKGRPFL